MGKVRKKYQRGKEMKACLPDEFGFSKQQYDVVKGVKDDKKVKPKDVFEGYSDKKTSKPPKKKGKGGSK